MLSTNYYNNNNNHFVNSKCIYIDCGIATNQLNNNSNKQHQQLQQQEQQEQHSTSPPSSTYSTSPNSSSSSSCSSRRNSPSQLNRFPFLSDYLSGSADLLVKKMEAGVTEILEVILQWLIEDLNESTYILFTAFFLADKYVKKVGIRQSSVLWLILTSCIVAIKMYSESKINMNRIASKFDTNPTNIIKMEMEFLSIMCYRLYVEEQTVNAFLTHIFFEFRCNITDRTQAIMKDIQKEIQRKEQQQQQQQP
ncbi:hypothetical protein PPL_10559 [Heterostelium album PN500]|uniref:Uncharacterized protein n=1 Tax=Heterostelium pallidum (strain ATCC 26659 / Pp 5 / PN500) TaxID=670386 RepID=D3BRE9_HETP5|nr:hypothetical protein PPL_10559 [Heterostelium album PN500]EFA75981.1 hypothetical protein PPL_10559 [Heterostelium album PN500]|eukprot:XP_020428115.1 hypothetical protein PPL_10559 [Heterostelium album PN500]